VRAILALLLIVPVACAADGVAVLAHNCFTCHAGSALGGLQLDTREHALKGGKSGPAIVPGDPDHSLLIQAVTRSHERLKMPPSGRLPESEISALVTWVKDGAKYPEAAPKTAEYKVTAEQRSFWAFQPIKTPPRPLVNNSKWAKTEIDRFVLARLELKGLKPVAAADRNTWIRRVTLDLTGLPPTPEEMNVFVADHSPEAFAKVVDRLLASPHYGERWGRYWLDVARYSDDKLDSERDNPYANAFRYRDWVIQAMNDDMPFSDFIKAQIAGDQMSRGNRSKYEGGLGFYALSPEFQDDRVDATARGFLGLTVACAQCHDHKFDPIPTKDYYALLGVFTSSKLDEYPLAPEGEVKAWQAKKKAIDDQKAAIADFTKKQADSLSEILAARLADYMTGTGAGLDSETRERVNKYLSNPQKDHPFLKEWFASHSWTAAEKFQDVVIAVDVEKKRIDDENHITLGVNPDRSKLSQASLKSMDRDKFVLWRDLFGDNGVLYYKDAKLDRFLGAAWKGRLDEMRASLAILEKDLPPQYPFLHALTDIENPRDERIQIRGSRESLGDVAPRAFLTILAKDKPQPFAHGSGRLELAEAIASPDNPLTARVIANRIWQHHFGQGLVRTPSNFGQLGDRPSHPELLDYLARYLIDNGWSLKKLHRAILLSSVYALSSAYDRANEEADPENRLLWRFNRHRLDAESMRDSLLFVAGNLDTTPGGPPARLSDEFRKRAVYGFVSRRRLDGYLSLFDFPNPNGTSEQRLETNVPLQRLFFMNSELINKEAGLLAARLKGPSDTGKIREAYSIVYSRPPTAAEIQLGLKFLDNNSWPQYAQALLSANEFEFVN
jgi:hypothetical protein